VAYFTAGHAVPGKPTIQLAWNGGPYRFATVKHLKLFAADPTRYTHSSVAIVHSPFP
jgi:YHS domain-containing protein